jgi:hypothetical protein
MPPAATTTITIVHHYTQHRSGMTMATSRLHRSLPSLLPPSTRCSLPLVPSSSPPLLPPRPFPLSPSSPDATRHRSTRHIYWIVMPHCTRPWNA